MSRIPDDIETRLRAAAPSGISYEQKTDPLGVTVAWCELANKDELLAIAECLARCGARLSMITGSQPPAPPEVEAEESETDAGDGVAEAASPEPTLSFGGTPLDGTAYELDYHFDLAGDALTVVALVAQGSSIASLTPVYRTADWPEREIMELYGLRIVGHPDPRRLFLDKSIEPAVLERLIPFSTLTNATSTSDLWSKVMEAGKEASQ
ncbi:NADH-quinone oxidoreductase subunit C [Consotaella salsifontis]|uniref:Respiratory-chain NADH dehydrogenase, subunit n=1 Tax=Consotaella salsifontis TaxID=1365950 RepID=A0A1T4MGX2_9HYPH|nr:NADH-quinone oxidoreductase subunit C [Consotaella salsifontis]SJZ66340.1 Respiratory-chain NADH dehydrogenase, subunit [Consotaella salsifontis]